MTTHPQIKVAFSFKVVFLAYPVEMYFLTWQNKTPLECFHWYSSIFIFDNPPTGQSTLQHWSCAFGIYLYLSVFYLFLIITDIVWTTSSTWMKAVKVIEWSLFPLFASLMIRIALLLDQSCRYDLIKAQSKHCSQ